MEERTKLNENNISQESNLGTKSKFKINKVKLFSAGFKFII